MAGFLALGVVFGIGKMWHDFRAWRDAQMRDKAPWERAMDDFRPRT